MFEDIPLATPYPWDNLWMVEAQRQGNNKLRKKRFMGSGFKALYKNALKPNTKTGSLTKSLLVHLLQQHGIENRTEEVDPENDADAMYGRDGMDLNRSPATSGTADDNLLQAARSGRLSLFASILSVLEEEKTPVSTKTFIRTCCLTLRPGDLPGSVDAKEMVLSALHFLSSDCNVRSDQFVSLPLLRPTQDVGDLEKRNYEKAGNWTLSKIKEQVLRLETIFLSSPSSWKWLRREAMCPRLAKKDEDVFFLKGNIPASASAKRTKTETTRKRKAPSTTPVTHSSPTNDSAFDATPVVEATIVADGSSP